MPFNSQGQWVPEDDSVSTRVNALTAQDSPYIRQARAAGTSTANRRGLLNSSMAAGASEGAAISAALPIASQESQQIAQRNFAHQQGGYDMERQRLVTASGDRNAALSAAIQANQNYLAAFTDLASNRDIPAATRDAYIQHLLNTRGTGMDMIQQIYGISLDWGQGPNNPAAGPISGSYGVVPTNRDGVQGGGGGYNSFVPSIMGGAYRQAVA